LGHDGGLNLFKMLLAQRGGRQIKRPG
jgi:hypothetical protein